MQLSVAFFSSSIPMSKFFAFEEFCQNVSDGALIVAGW
jgi:hypothetical protein